MRPLGCFLAALLVALVVAASAAAVPALEGKHFRIVSVYSDKCLDVYQQSKQDGANVQQWSCHGGQNQLWEFVTAGGDTYQIVNVNSGKCLDVDHWSTESGANVKQWSSHGGDNQLWYVNDVGGDSYRIVNKHSGLCLDLTESSSDNGANIQQWHCEVGENQEWRLEEVCYHTSPWESDTHIGTDVTSPGPGIEVPGTWTTTDVRFAGGGIGLGHIDSDDDLDAVLFAIYDYEAKARMRWNVGWDLDCSGRARGWVDMGVFSFPWAWWAKDAPSGLGVTIGNLDNDSRPELVLFAIQGVTAANSSDIDLDTAYYWILWNLTASGANPSYTSFSSHEISELLGFENAGGGATLADLDSNGKQELIVYNVQDQGDRDCAGEYHIGWNLSSTTGEPTKWTTHKEADFSSNVVGAGVAACDIDRNGVTDLVTYTRRIGGWNKGYGVLRVGWNLNSQGVAQSWSPEYEVVSHVVDFGLGLVSGLEVADIDGNGVVDLAISFLSHDAYYHYTVGWNVTRVSGSSAIQFDGEQ